MSQDLCETIAFYVIIGQLTISERSSIICLIKQADSARANAEINIERKSFFLGEARKLESEARYLAAHFSAGHLKHG